MPIIRDSVLCEEMFEQEAHAEPWRLSMFDRMDNDGDNNILESDYDGDIQNNGSNNDGDNNTKEFNDEGDDGLKEFSSQLSLDDSNPMIINQCDPEEGVVSGIIEHCSYKVG